MIFFHKPYYTTLTIQTLTKKSLNDICPRPKKLCKTYKLYNAKQIFFKEHRKKSKNQILKLLNYKHLLIKNKNLNLQKQKQKKS